MGKNFSFFLKMNSSTEQESEGFNKDTCTGFKGSGQKLFSPNNDGYCFGRGG